jgi:hypothetical protein
MEAISRFLLTLLLFASVSAFSTAQERYTVNRPTTTPLTESVSASIPQHTFSVRWETDYDYAKRMAEQSARCLLIYLYAENDSELPEAPAPLPIIDACRGFSTVVLDDTVVRAGLDKYVLLKLPMSAKITSNEGTEQSIYSQPGFEHMLDLPGLVVIDFAHPAPYYGEIVGILPFLRGESPTAKQVDIFLNLPPGTLTQRTLTYAVRIHPDRPLSTDGEPSPIVMQAATDHALYQAERGVLGHQNFGARSAQVKALLNGSGSPSEICAQTQNSLSLFEAALASMRMWRNSSGHWSIARKHHTYYGYDMVRGKNGSWYAVGFFIQ